MGRLRMKPGELNSLINKPKASPKKSKAKAKKRAQKARLRFSASELQKKLGIKKRPNLKDHRYSLSKINDTTYKLRVHFKNHTKGRYTVNVPEDFPKLETHKDGTDTYIRWSSDTEEWVFEFEKKDLNSNNSGRINFQPFNVDLDKSTKTITITWVEQSLSLNKERTEVTTSGAVKTKFKLNIPQELNASILTIRGKYQLLKISQSDGKVGCLDTSMNPPENLSSDESFWSLYSTTLRDGTLHIFKKDPKDSKKQAADRINAYIKGLPYMREAEAIEEKLAYYKGKKPYPAKGYDWVEGGTTNWAVKKTAKPKPKTAPFDPSLFHKETNPHKQAEKTLQFFKKHFSKIKIKLLPKEKYDYKNIDIFRYNVLTALENLDTKSLQALESGKYNLILAPQGINIFTGGKTLGRSAVVIDYDEDPATILENIRSGLWKLGVKNEVSVGDIAGNLRVKNVFLTNPKNTNLETLKNNTANIAMAIIHLSADAQAFVRDKVTIMINPQHVLTTQVFSKSYYHEGPHPQDPTVVYIDHNESPFEISEDLKAAYSAYLDKLEQAKARPKVSPKTRPKRRIEKKEKLPQGLQHFGFNEKPKKDGIKKLKAEIQRLKDTIAQNKDKLIVVDFSAKDCGPCKILKPHYKKLANQPHKSLTFMSMDTWTLAYEDEDEETMPLLNEHFNFGNWPTIVIYKGGKPVAHIRGASWSVKEVSDKINTMLKVLDKNPQGLIDYKEIQLMNLIDAGEIKNGIKAGKNPASVKYLKKHALKKRAGWKKVYPLSSGLEVNTVPSRLYEDKTDKVYRKKSGRRYKYYSDIFDWVEL